MSDKTLPADHTVQKNYGREVDRSFLRVDYLGKKLVIGLFILLGEEKKHFTVIGDGKEETVTFKKLNGEEQVIQGVTWEQMTQPVNFGSFVTFIDNKIADWSKNP